MPHEIDRLIVENAAMEAAFALLARELKDTGLVGRPSFEAKLRSLGMGLVTGSRQTMTQEIGEEVLRLVERIA